MAEPQVVMLTGFAPRVGGAERQAQRLARALQQRGARVRVLTPRESPDLPERETVAGIPVRRISFPRLRGVGAAVLSARVLADLLRGADDVIHVHISGPMVIPAVLGGRVRGVPTVLKFANLSPERGIWVDVPQAAFRRWPLEAATRRVDGVVAISSRIARAAEEGGWWQVARIPNGIDPEEGAGERPPRAQARRWLGLRGDPVALFVGRLSHQKGLDVLLRIWRRFLESRPGATLLVLGEGPDGASLRRQAVALGVAGSVDFRGLRKDVAPHYAAADLFVLPSRYEGLPNVMLEAMAAGLPVIASRVSGTEDAIEDGRNGLLVPPGEPAALLDALLRLTGDRGMGERLGKEARKTVEGRYHINRVAEETLAFYRHLIDRR
jgi:glycosyltransferase involved in cell wall biosynthesis